MPTRFRVLLTDKAWPDTGIERAILAEVDAELVEPPAADEATLSSLAVDVDAIAATWGQVTAKVVRVAERCRIISRMGIGLDNISVETATALTIPVTNIPDYCVGEVADHTLALLLAAARNVAFFHLRTKRGEYQLQAGPPARRLQGQVLGLVGLGQIARNLVPKARALGLEIIACTPSGNDYGTGCRMVSFPQLLATSDFISLHAPLNSTTRGLFGLAEFSQMKRTATLINTSRGPLIKHADLWLALQQNLLAGAALDVFDPEPPNLSDPLFQHERVIATPHAAFLSQEALCELRTRVFRQIIDALSGKRPENVINPQVFTMTQRFPLR